MRADFEKPKIKGAAFYKTFRILGDVVFVPFFIIILISTILMFSAKVNNEVPTLFGYSALKVVSASMSPTLEEGDIVVVKVIETEKLVQNFNNGQRDIIAFYEYTGEFNESTATSPEEITGGDSNIDTSIGAYLGGGTDKKVQDYSRVIIHRIIDCKVQKNPNDPNYGKYFFQTQGDKNTAIDNYWVMEDYVVGTYHSQNNLLGAVFTFCISMPGIIVLVLIPSVCLMVMLIISIAGQYKQIKLDKKFEEEQQIATQRMMTQTDLGVTNNLKRENTILENIKKVDPSKQKKMDKLLSKAEAKANKNQKAVVKTENVENVNVNQKPLPTVSQHEGKAVIPPRPGVAVPPRPSVGLPPRPGIAVPPKPGIAVPPKPSVGLPQKPGAVVPPRPSVNGAGAMLPPRPKTPPPPPPKKN